ncbi:hypothetical protein Rhopal_005139-T1 [Rhodotorula paludigena]|uniref:Rdx family-domain-containing protein n=1 Tax=Rhodotorula paludigena TaxID=86838 RepID=A0AAV5GQF3_9BASI|nr:hypothetical protein Rhopal_005139-T1 [Rhodotorula paludigena]
MAEQDCATCPPSTSAAPPQPGPAFSSPSKPPSDPLLDPSTFEPPVLNQGEDREELPRVVIEFCDRCRWIHRATWTQTELFLTFPPAATAEDGTSPGLRSITLVPRNAPETGGRFRVWLLRYRSIEQEFEESLGKEKWNGWELVWDRKVEGGFPELKDLKQRIRNLIAPSQGLGHSDKPSKVSSTRSAPPAVASPANTAAEAAHKPVNGAADAAGGLKEGAEDAPTEWKATDWEPKFRCG